MITTIAHDLSADFDKKQLMPLFQFFENVFSVYVWFASSRYFIKVKHINRLIFNSLVMMISYGLLGILIIYKFKFGFYLSLFWAVLHGLTQAFGEATILGLLKGFPSSLVGPFTIGLGMSGLFGAGILVILKPFISSGYIFLFVTPLTLVYLINGILLVRKRANYIFIDETSISRENINDSEHYLTSNSMIKSNSKSQTNNKNPKIAIDIGDDAHKNLPMNFTNASQVMQKSGWYMINISLIYFMQYCSITSFADIFSSKLK